MPLDYMHLVCIGVMKKLLHNLISKYNINQTKITERMKLFKLPKYYI